MPLAPFDLFPSIVATHPFDLCGFDTLTIQTSRRWMFMAPRLLPNSGSQRVVQPLPRALVPPLAKIMIHTLPLRIFPRQHPPLDPAHHDIQDGVQDLAHVQRARSTARLCGRNQLYANVPLTVGYIGWV